MYNDTRQLVGKIDILYTVDKNDIIRLVASDDESQGSLVGIDISYRDFVNQTKATLKPVFSTGLRSFDDTYRIIITYPIINRVWAENNSDGKGATFIFLVPLSC